MSKEKIATDDGRKVCWISAASSMQKLRGAAGGARQAIASCSLHNSSSRLLAKLLGMVVGPDDEDPHLPLHNQLLQQQGRKYQFGGDLLLKRIHRERIMRESMITIIYLIFNCIPAE